MRRLFLFLTTILLASSATAASTKAPQELKDLYYGEALYCAFLEEWFEAITRLDTELGQYYELDQPELDPFFAYSRQAAFAVGDFELAYRMHQRAGRAMNAVIEADVEPLLRNETLYRLAKIQFQKDHPVRALHALERIAGPVPPAIKDDLDFLHAQVLLANARFEDAVKILLALKDVDALVGFREYNLGIALIRQGKEQEGRNYLDLGGQIESDDPVVQSIRDKLNLTLGEMLLKDEDLEHAKEVLERVRLDGPFSNQALLGAGWADVAQERFDRALVPWTLLSEREVSDLAVQEALLGVPYAYGELEIYNKAAAMYEHVLDVFGHEIDKLSVSLSSVREGRFLDALLREELKLDSNWVVRLRELPDTPETYYLLDLMASHDFQESLKNYLDLEQLRKKLVAWDRDLDAFKDMIEKRSAYYQPLLPSIDSKFRSLDSQMRLRLEQREHIEQRLQAMLVAPRPDFLSTSQERIALESIARIEASLADVPPSSAADVRDRLDRLRGLLVWDIRTSYDQRLTETFVNLQDLNADVEKLKLQYNSFVRVRQAAMQSFQGYDETLHSIRLRIKNARAQVETVMARQGHVLEVMAENELINRRDRLEEFQVKARFAMADSYDRAAREQARAKGE